MKFFLIFLVGQHFNGTLSSDVECELKGFEWKNKKQGPLTVCD